MRNLSRNTSQYVLSVLFLSMITASFSSAQIVIKDSIDIGPRALLHPLKTSSSNLTIEIPWLGELPTGVHLEVMDPNGSFWGFDPYSESASGDYIEVTDGPDGGVSRLTISSPTGGFYQIMAIVDTTVDPFYWRRLYANIYFGSDTSSVSFSDYFGDVYDTRFHEGVAYWTVYIPCVSDGLTLVVPQLGTETQPSIYPLEVDSYVQDGCGNYADPGPGYFVRAEIVDSLRWGDLFDPTRGKSGAVLDSIPILYGLATFDYRPWGDEVSIPEQVNLKISSTMPGFAPVIRNLQVVPGNPPLEVLINRDTISFGDTTCIKFVMINSDSTPSTGELVGSRFTIVEGDSGAFLYSPDSSIVGRDILDVDSVRLYVPPGANSSDSSSIKIVVTADEPCPECGAAVASRDGSGTLSSTAVKVKPTKIKGKTSLAQQEALYHAKMLALWKKGASARKTSVALSKHSKGAPKIATTLSSKGKVSPKGAWGYDGIVTTHAAMGIVTTIKRKSLKILNHQPWVIWPSLPPQIDKNGAKESRGADRPGYIPTRPFSILALDEMGKPLVNAAVTIKTTFTSKTGGHGHVNGKVDLPQSSQGEFWGQRDHDNPLIDLITDENGTVQIDSFTNHQVSGSYIVTAFLQADSTVKDTVQLTVQVPNLVDFSLINTSIWSLTGTITDMGKNHLSNHWCSQKTFDSLTAAMVQFHSWVNSEQGENRNVVLGINDMSLKWGGVFDIKGDWNVPGSSSHSFHRVGLSVDIDNADLKTQNPRKPKDDKAKILTLRGTNLQRIMLQYGGKLYNEPQIHFGFDGGY